MFLNPMLCAVPVSGIFGPWWAGPLLALIVGLVIVAQPGMFYLLIGGYFIVTGGLMLAHDPGNRAAIATIGLGLVILILVRLLLYLCAAYFLIVGVMGLVAAGFTGPVALAFLAAALLFIFPKLLPYIVAGYLILTGFVGLLWPVFAQGYFQPA